MTDTHCYGLHLSFRIFVYTLLLENTDVRDLLASTSGKWLYPTYLEKIAY